MTDSVPDVSPPRHQPGRRMAGRALDLSRHVAVMAVVNRTPDSFYDRGSTFALDAAVAAALAAVDDGADIVDVGGAPFAPGPDIPVAVELARVEPVVAAIRAASDVMISVDTFQPEVAKRSIAAGADLINDTTGLRNPELAAVIAEGGAGVIVTHSLAAPRTAFPRPMYSDVVAEVVAFLAARAEFARSAGIAADRIIVDPGHDLNKNTLHSLELTRRFGEIAALGYPALAAVSNKDFVGETLGRDRDDRVAGSLAAAVVAIMNGARVIRMHNVRPAVDAARMTEAILGLREPAYLRHNMGETND
ncbi:dihydropteroate synthase [Mycetocola zhujimingii]|uniref:dihydropteroate synthase n=1 Tax=Mycetocola zhujimingii TaxID=2079792 RepID=UPI000D396720|nr:dihydropteroate synthase [Mycetocola zhujimingii]AWB87045.1 dihydropteroate synthase [Mycetocola zhujimingii]